MTRQRQETQPTSRRAGAAGPSSSWRPASPPVWRCTASTAAHRSYPLDGSCPSSGGRHDRHADSSRPQRKRLSYDPAAGQVLQVLAPASSSSMTASEKLPPLSAEQGIARLLTGLPLVDVLHRCNAREHLRFTVLPSGSHDRRQLMAEADRRSSDELPRTRDPDEEADDYEHRDPPRSPHVTRSGDEPQRVVELKTEYNDKASQEQDVSGRDGMGLTNPAAATAMSRQRTAVLEDRRRTLGRPTLSREPGRTARPRVRC